MKNIALYITYWEGETFFLFCRRIIYFLLTLFAGILLYLNVNAVYRKESSMGCKIRAISFLSFRRSCEKEKGNVIKYEVHSARFATIIFNVLFMLTAFLSTLGVLRSFFSIINYFLTNFAVIKYFWSIKWKLRSFGFRSFLLLKEFFKYVHWILCGVWHKFS